MRISSIVDRVQLLFVRLISVFMVITCLTTAVSADMGPKPSITINLSNGPEGEFFVGLLYESSADSFNLDWVHKDYERKGYEKQYTEAECELILKLYEYNETGWCLYCSPVGPQVIQSNPENSYYFYYMVPDVYRIIIVTSDGNIHLSEVHTKENFISVCDYDFAANVITELKNQGDTHYLSEVLVVLIATLAVEFLVMLIFGLVSRRNIKYFLLINVLTQALLDIYLFVGYQLGFVMHSNYLIHWIVAEAVIFVTEMLYYRKRLVNRNGEINTRKNLRFGFTANFVSWGLDLLLIVVYELLFGHFR